MLRTRSATRVIAASVAAAVLASCTASSSSPGLERPTRDHPIKCEAPETGLRYFATFTPGRSGNRVDMLMVTFDKRPTSTDVERVLRRCLQIAATSVRIDYQTIANAFHNDAGPLPLSDGSSSLFYDPTTSKVQTAKELFGGTSQNPK
jgi:hypothetical protein